MSQSGRAYRNAADETSAGDPGAALKFAIVAPNFHPRTCGIGDNSLHLGEELLRRGYAVELFTRTPAETHPDAPALTVHGIPGASPLIISERIRRAVIRSGATHMILQYVPQIWGASRFGTPAAVWLASAVRRAGIKVIVIVHELFLELGPRPDWIVSAALHRAQIMGVARASDRLFVTTGTRVEALMPFWRAARVPGRPGVVRIGPGALPLPRIRRPGRARLGLFSTLAGNKRFDLVLGAFEQIWRRRPESELVVIGDLGRREAAHVAAFFAAVERHPARDRIRLTGKLSLQQVAAEMAELDVYLFPMTTGANTRSSTLPVALGAGLPVVAMRGVETDPELFRDGENVAFAEAFSADAFAGAALKILESPALSERLSTGARQLYDEHLEWSRVVDDLLADVLG
jgi:glycosyltransferase involved in cell wall biosynthesis